MVNPYQTRKKVGKEHLVVVDGETGRTNKRLKVLTAQGEHVEHSSEDSPVHLENDILYQVVEMEFLAAAPSSYAPVYSFRVWCDTLNIEQPLIYCHEYVLAWILTVLECPFDSRMDWKSLPSLISCDPTLSAKYTGNKKIRSFCLLPNAQLALFAGADFHDITWILNEYNVYSSIAYFWVHSLAVATNFW